MTTLAQNPLYLALQRIKLGSGGTVYSSATPEPRPQPTAPTVLPGASQGGIRSVEDAKDIAKRGAVDPSWGNLGQMMNTGFGLMGGMGALKSAVQQGLASTDLGAFLGIDKPFEPLKGYVAPTKTQINEQVTSSNPLQARAQAGRLTQSTYDTKKAQEKKAREFADARTARGQRGLSRDGNRGSRSGPSGGSSRGSRGE